VTRELDMATLTAAASYYAGLFLLNVPPLDRDHVVEEFYKFDFADEFDVLHAALRDQLGKASRQVFDSMAAKRFKPRSREKFHDLLAKRLAITPSGEHIEGKIGTSIIGGRLIGEHLIEVEVPESIAYRRRFNIPKSARRTHIRKAKLVWPIYAGEGDERIRGAKGVADPLPPGTPGLPLGAFNTRISNEVAQLMANAGVDNLDEGTLGAVIQGRTGAQPADPDTAVTGTNLFTMTASATAFGAATDAAPGALKTANAITDDSSADATGTLGYVRASSSSVADTPLDDHIDGEAGTSGADWNFNTLSIVSGSTVSATSWTVTQPES
jgi:hypothetical protein